MTTPSSHEHTSSVSASAGEDRALEARRAMRRWRVTPHPNRSRIVLFHLGTYLMRADNLRREYFGDLDRASVLITAWLGGVERPIRGRESREEISSLDDRLEYEDLSSTNATSVAAATSLPRQTVSRKLSELEKAGMLVGLGGGRYRLCHPHENDYSKAYESFVAVIRASVGFMNNAIAHEALILEESYGAVDGGSIALPYSTDTQGGVDQRRSLRRYRLLPDLERSRFFMFNHATWLMRADSLRRSSPMGELDRAGIMITLWLHALEPGLHKPDTREQLGSLADRLDYEALPTSNATSIAASTGLARETVRRKLKELEAEGVIVGLERGKYRLQHANPEVGERLSQTFQQLIQESVRFINASIADETLYFEEAERMAKGAVPDGAT